MGHSLNAPLALRERAGVRAQISPRPSDGRGAGGEGDRLSPRPLGERRVRAIVYPLARPTGEGPGVRAIVCPLALRERAGVRALAC